MSGFRTCPVTLLLEVVQGVCILLTDHIDVRLDDDGVCKCLRKLCWHLRTMKSIPNGRSFTFRTAPIRRAGVWLTMLGSP